jgi:hypothetical protein
MMSGSELSLSVDEVDGEVESEETRSKPLVLQCEENIEKEVWNTGVADLAGLGRGCKFDFDCAIFDRPVMGALRWTR